MESEDSDSSPTPTRRVSSRCIIESSSDSDCEVVPYSAETRKRKRTSSYPADDASSSSTNSSFPVMGKKKWRPAVISDTDSDTSSSDSDNGKSVNQNGATKEPDSSDSDGQSDKCPICLKTFKLEEVATPESCDHTFCIECIREWSKNVNTCPVDRQTFSLILVRSQINGKAVRQIPIEVPSAQEEQLAVQEDPTFCEVCGRSDREDRMLLCDGCDLGYHLDCLTPPRDEIPAGAWFCTDCGPTLMNQDFSVNLEEVELLLNDAADLPQPSGNRRNVNRLIPRTRQSERVRELVLGNRARRFHESATTQSQALDFASIPGTSTTARRRTSATKTRKRKKRARKRNPRIKVTYQIDEETGQEYVFKTTISSYKKRRKRKTKKARLKARQAAMPKTAKKRLAEQLGMYGRKYNQQVIPEVRSTSENTTINYQRYQAGIPTLRLFGNREELDYFSDVVDDAEEGEGSLLVARRPNMQDVALMRRERRKNISITPGGNSFDILGSILESQERFHSRNSVLSITNDGRLKVESNNNQVEVRKGDGVKIRKAATGTEGNRANNSESKESDGGVGDSSNNINSDNASYSVTTTSQARDYAAESVLEPENNEQNNSESELDIYSDIETVSTSNKVEEEESKPITPVEVSLGSDDEANNSDIDLVIDTEKQDLPEVETSKEETVTSTTNPNNESIMEHDDEDSEDGCPNFSIYSTESIKLAKTSDLQLIQEKIMINQTNEVGSSLDVKDSESDEQVIKSSSLLDQKNEPKIIDSSSINLNTSDINSSDNHKISNIDSGDHLKTIDSDSSDHPKTSNLNSSDEHINNSDLNSSDDHIDTCDILNSSSNPQKIADSSADKDSSTSDSSDDEQKDTQLEISIDDARKQKSKKTALYSDSDDEVIKIDKNQKRFEIADLQGMTEDISEEERSYTPCLDERGVLEGLETEAISDEEKNDFDESHDNEVKTTSDGDALEINAKESELDLAKPEDFEEGEIVDKLKKLEEAAKKLEGTDEATSIKNKDEMIFISLNTIGKNTFLKDTTFKKITKINRSRNYRDKDKERSKSPGKDKNDDRERRKRKEKRKEIVRYNVRSLVTEKPSRLKDRFGRDRRSASSHSNTPFSPRRRSYSRNRSATRRRSRSRSRSRRRRSTSRRRKRNRNSKEKKRNKSRNRTRSPTPKRRKDWERRSRGWSPSISQSHSPERQVSPSWTPPRLLEKPVKPHNLTVILTNDSQKKKKEKRKTEKRKKEVAPVTAEPQQRKKRTKRDKTPPPSKEVFASGDNILVSVSFNKENDEREAVVRKKREDPNNSTKKKSKRSPKVKRKKTHDLSAVKPVAIIDLDRSPFRELTPSPNDVIVLSDSDNTEQVENSNPPTDTYPSGPKTPPEPQVKFTLNSKQPQLRNINNPLHEPDENEMEICPQEELEQRLNDALHKGPNTPPDPPNSPPSSPDAYDPFDPTKSRSPTPEAQEEPSEKHDEGVEQQDSSLTPRLQSPDPKSHTPPVIPEIQPADSQSNTSMTTPDTKRTPERTIGVVINQVVIQPQSTSTPISQRSNSTTTTSTTQRTVVTKTSPTKIKLTTLNTNGTVASKTKTSGKKVNRSNDSNDSNVEFESPYSPGPSDYEDLFEPPIEPTKAKVKPKPVLNKPQNSFDNLFGTSPNTGANKKSNLSDKKKRTPRLGKTKSVGIKLDEDMLRIMDDVPNSAVELQVKDKFLKKLNRQERVVEEVKVVLKPHYNKKHINKEEYKDIMRRSVPKICHSKSGEINPKKIHNLIEAYVKKFRHSKKVSSSSSVNPQK